MSRSKWFEEFENVLELAKWLADEGRITTAHATLQIFEKPWKWEPEWNEYQAALKVITIG